MTLKRNVGEIERTLKEYPEEFLEELGTKSYKNSKAIPRGISEAFLEEFRRYSCRNWIQNTKEVPIELRNILMKSRFSGRAPEEFLEKISVETRRKFRGIARLNPEKETGGTEEYFL